MENNENKAYTLKWRIMKYIEMENNENKAYTLKWRIMKTKPIH